MELDNTCEVHGSFEDWFTIDCIPNDEDKIFESLKSNHEQCMDRFSNEDTILSFSFTENSDNISNGIDLKTSISEKVKCEKFLHNDKKLLCSNLVTNNAKYQHERYTSNNYSQHRTPLKENKPSTLLTLFTKPEQRTINYDINPFRSLHANILRLQGYEGRNCHLPNLKRLLQLTSICNKSLENVKLESAQHALENAAALIIQDFWKCCIFKALYLHLRNLLFRYSGLNPSIVLRPINPNEATLLDAASGSYIRFRLGGTTFPPIILYKIFTRRPVIDICLRNSSSEDLLKHRSKQVGDYYSKKIINKPSRSNEHNEWRPFDDTLIQSAQVASEIHVRQKKNPKPVSHNQRSREEQIRQRKKQKVERMMKLYKLGKQAESLHSVTEDKLKDSSPEKNNLSHTNKSSAILEYVDRGINLEKYHKDWSFTATTEVTDKHLINN